GGRFSHAVHKPLVEGFKVNEVLGKTFYRPYNPTEEEKDLGRAVIECLGIDPDVMRLDIVRTREGPKIMEVEMINPAIYEDVPVLGDIFFKNFCDHIEKRYLR
ncbi:MAG: hypothetical protein KJ574_00535, partial [Nanoarchaeota archaeon]|nr:hypothetical protein [Nanoarchaeota archaeon]